jgi:hypothetical protein
MWGHDTIGLVTVLIEAGLAERRRTRDAADARLPA